MMKLVLFDIDGTLLTCGPQVRPLFASALVEVFGTAGEVDAFDFTGSDFAGWCREVGFRDVDITPLAGPASAGIAYK